MVVEDEPEIYDLLLAMFGVWGIEGVAFVDGLEAIAWIDEVDQGRIRGELPELAMIDIRLLDIEGQEVGARIRRSPVLHDIAIVLITAYILSPDAERKVMEVSQADLFLYKPLPAMHQLRKQLDAIIARRSGPDRSAIQVDEQEKAIRAKITQGSTSRALIKPDTLLTPTTKLTPPRPVKPVKPPPHRPRPATDERAGTGREESQQQD